ncbi:MAG: energy transducer TonB [Acidobacteriia bacterium]|nr:energy transducer TonB [Terriglobia bacterium]
MPELAMQAETPTSEAAPLPQLVVEARTAAEAVPPMVEPAPPPAQPQLQPDERPIEPPSFRLLESDDPLLERSNREEYTGAAEPELLSILDPAPRPAPACCMGGSVHRRLTIVIAVLVSMAIGSAVYRGTRRMNRFTPPAPTDGAAYSVGAGVTVPALRFKVEPEYTEEARQAKIQGTVVLYVEIDPRGNPIHIRVLRGLDLGLSERAIEAVRKWRFRPGTKDGQPVTTRATVEVHFRLP